MRARSSMACPTRSGRGRGRNTPKPGTRTGGVMPPDGTATALIPESLLEGILRTYAPRRIVLFGSAARGTAGPDSDLDLLVVLDDDVSPGVLKWQRIHEARKSYKG